MMIVLNFKLMLLVIIILSVNFSANAGCDSDMADSELQIASGMNEKTIRKMIEHAKLTTQKENQHALAQFKGTK